MSLEREISELTATVCTLIEVLKAHPLMSEAPSAVPGEPKAPKSVATASKPADVVSVTPQNSAQSGEQGNAPSESSTPTSGEQSQQTLASSLPELTYDDVAKTIVALSKVDLQKAKDVLARFGVKNGKQLTPEQWPDAKKLAEDALAGGEV